MDLTLSPSEEGFRDEVATWLHANNPGPEPEGSLDEVMAFRGDWQRKLHAAGWAGISWPKEFGGRGATMIEQAIFTGEAAAQEAPSPANVLGLAMGGPVVIAHGTEAQKSRYLSAMAAGDEIWAQAWSEPQAGSDLAALRSTARRDGDHYVLNGHKIWSSRAVFADWAFGMFRTDPASERHKGISFILVPLDTPGIRVRGIPQIDGEAGFAEIFFEDARVPVENRLGGEGQGWSIAMATAGFERGLMLRSPARFQATAAKLVQLYRRHADTVDPAIGSAVAQCWMDAEAYALATYATASRLIKGGTIGVEASLNKIFWSELDGLMHRLALDMLGARAELRRWAPDAGEVGDWLDGYLFALAGPIYAGTNEIQRNIIAERLLGLPKG